MLGCSFARASTRRDAHAKPSGSKTVVGFYIIITIIISIIIIIIMIIISSSISSRIRIIIIILIITAVGLGGGAAEQDNRAKRGKPYAYASPCVLGGPIIRGVGG